MSWVVIKSDMDWSLLFEVDEEADRNGVDHEGNGVDDRFCCPEAYYA